MKIYKYILIIGVLFFTSCSDFLDVKPANVLIVSSYPDVKALMGTHIKMFKDGNSGLLSGTRLPFYSENEDYILFYFYSDDFNSETYLNNWTGENNRGLLLKSINWEENTINESIWKNYYGNIGFYNMILQQLELYPGKDSYQTNIIKGEAKVLRAWSFFKLLQYFSPYHKGEYGLPLNTDPEAVGSYDSKRRTQTENYEFVINELKEVLSYDTSASPSYNLFFNKNIINAILAQVYLYKGDSGAKADDDYSNAITYATKALKEGNLSFSNFDRNPKKGDEFTTYTNKPYALLSFMLPSPNMSNIVGYPQYGLGQRSSESLYSLFSDADKRKIAFFNSNKEIIKFEGDFNFAYYKIDFFTAAELQLIIAESYARQGKDTEAEVALNEFTKTRYSSYDRDSNKTLLENILDERRKEFCFEYDMRWLDLTRLQKGWSRKNPAKDDDTKIYTLKDNDFRFCMPIPAKTELEHNKIPQNPGW